MKTSASVQILLRSLFLAALLVGCVGKEQSTLQTASPGGKLYISNAGDSSLLIYGDIINAFGPPAPLDCTTNSPTTTCNLVPTEKIQDLRTQNVIRNPFSVFVDVVNDRLYAANTGLNQILIYNNASTVSSNVAPDRVISGNATTLNFPRGIAAGGANMTMINNTITALSTVISSTATTIPVVSTTGFPSIGSIRIDNEIISYTGVTATSFTGATRAQGGSTAASHLTGRTVTVCLLLNATTIPVVSTTGFPSIGSIRIDNEIVSYTGLTATSFTGADRGVNGTIAANHFSGALIFGGASILYVSNMGGNSILVFDVSDAVLNSPSPLCTTSGSTATCNLPPIRTMTGLSRPFGLDLDVINDGLYVANEGQSSILVFDNVSSPATLTPTRTITFSNSDVSLSIPRLSDPSGIFVDTDVDPDGNSANGTGTIYVANNGNNSILVFNNASHINGETIPDRSISGGQTNLSDPVGIFMDNYAREFGTVTSATSITLTDASKSFAVDQFVNYLVVITSGTGQGQVRTITSNTATQLLVSPSWDTTPNSTSIYQIRQDLLYVANNATNSILSYNNASTTSGNIAPDRIITGASTLLSSPEGIFIANMDPDANPLNGTGVLYAANFSTNSIVVFNNASTATDNISPVRTVQDTVASLPSPSGLSVDIEHDRLYMTTPGVNSIQVIDHASQLQSASPPVITTISGATTTLNGAADVFADAINDMLYVANTNANSILVFNNALTTLTANITAADTAIPVVDTTDFPTAGTIRIESENISYAGLTPTSFTGAIRGVDGTTAVSHTIGATVRNNAPNRTIIGAATALSSPSGIYVDTTNDQIYVANTGSNSILVFNNAGTVSGNVTPTRIIAGGLTTLSTPSDIFVDTTNDQIYVANTGSNSILVFNNAGTVSGNVTPARIIAGGLTTLSTPNGIYVDIANDLLYIANSGANSILVFNGASTVSGNVAPTNVISGTSTTLNTPLGIFVDTTR